MQKKIEIVVRNLMVFWIFVDLMPGIDTLHGFGGLFIASIMFAGIRLMLPWFLKFFKFPKHFFSQLLIGTLLTMGFMFFLHYVLIGIIDFGSGAIAPVNLGFVVIPGIENLNVSGIIIFGSLVVNICSIMIARLSKSTT